MKVLATYLWQFTVIICNIFLKTIFIEIFQIYVIYVIY